MILSQTRLMSRLMSLWVAAVLLLAPSSGAEEYGPHFDRRLSMAMATGGPSEAQLTAIAELRANLGGSLLETLDERSGATRTLSNPVGYLTGPYAGEPVDVATDFVRSSRDLLGLFPGDLDEMEICDVVVSKLSGATHVYFCQTHQGVPVFNGLLQVNVSRDGAILSVANSFVPDLQAHAQSSGLGSEIRAVDACYAVASHLGVRIRGRFDAEEISTEPIVEELMWLPVGSGVKLVWRFQVYTLDGKHAYDFTVAAESDDDPKNPLRVMTRFDWMSPGIYQVYPLPTESPNHASPAPPADGRSIVSFPADVTASPLGWHDDGATAYTIMRGNNVHAYDDADANELPPSVEPDCGAGLDCSFPIDLNADPTTYTAAAVANLFYWNNVIHDVQYQYGFDEAGGNFQKNNFGRGGLGGDDVRAEAQDGAGVDNANFLPAVDGSRPRIQMFLWDFTNPRRDGDFDNGVIIHEYGHGISTRLVGGPSNVGCLSNFQQPGEGLSDWWSLVYTARPGDLGTDARGIGTYVLGEPTNGSGIRTLPYSTDSNINDYTYASVAGMAVPHGVGEIWGQAAWEMYWALVNEYGFDPNLYDAMGGAGNQRAMLYVNEGLKNTICSPAFTDVRDGIIQAAVENYGGEDVCLLWEAFAEFGLGVDAVSGGPWSVNPTNGCDNPAPCLGPVITDPSPGSVLAGADVSFQWDASGQNVTEWWLFLGTTEGANDLHDSGSLAASTSTNVTGLPVDGSTIHARLRFRVDGGAWEYNDFIYTAADLIPRLLSPAPGSVLPGSQATFQWAENGLTVDDWQLQLGSAAGDADIYDSGLLGAVTTVTVSGIPTDGRTVHARLSFLIAGAWDFRDYTYIADIGDPEITAPVPGTVLPGATVTFEWMANGAPITDYKLYVGTVVGQYDIYSSGSLGTQTSVSVSGIPVNGSTVHVRLWSYYDERWSTRDFEYTAADLAVELTDPAPGSTLLGADATFTWIDNGVPVTEYKLYVGSGFGLYDLFNSGSLGTATSVLASGLPTDARTLYVRLWSRVSGLWKVDDYTYTAADFSPALVSPPPGSALSGANVTFAWTSNGATVTDWKLYLGTTLGAYNLFNSGILTTTSALATDLPTDASTIYARLWSRIGGRWETEDYVYTAATVIAVSMDAPVPGSVLSGADVTFQWSASGSVSQWTLQIGTTLGGNDLHDSGSLGTATSASVTGLPVDGQAIFVRLSSLVGGALQTDDFTYTAANLSPSMVSPIPNTTLSGSEVTFQWTDNGAPVTEWMLQVGTSLGGAEIDDIGSLGAATSRAVSGLPTDGSTVYVRLWYFANADWSSKDFQYTAGAAGAATPEILSPAPGTVLPGATVPFEWTANGAAVTDWKLYLGTTPGAYNIYYSGSLGAATSVTVSNLPVDGTPVHARLWYRIAGKWSTADFSYTAATLQPELVDPVPGTVLAGSDITFTWDDGGADVTSWRLYLGTAAGYYNLHYSGILGAGVLSRTVTGLPTDARTIYARLWYKLNGRWKTRDYQYTAAYFTPELLLPAPGTVLPGSSATFQWTSNGASVTDWKLYVGTGVGAYNVYYSGSLGIQTSVTVSTLPTAGQTLYVRLWAKVLNRWKTYDYQFTAASP